MNVYCIHCGRKIKWHSDYYEWEHVHNYLPTNTKCTKPEPDNKGW